MRNAKSFDRVLPLLVLCLFLGACSHMPRMLGGTPDEDMRLDGEQRHEVELNVGRTLSLDMRDPGLSGYVFAGTAFNPDLLRLDGIEPLEGGKRMATSTFGYGTSVTSISIHLPRIVQKGKPTRSAWNTRGHP